MLGKLLKHEWFATAKILLPLNILLVFITIIGKIIITLFPHGLDGAFSPVLVILLTLYILILITLSIVTAVYLIIRFYKNLFSHEGYLMFTLPTSTWSLLNAKLILAVFWEFVTTMNTILSIFILISAGIHNTKSSISFHTMNLSFHKETGLYLSTFIIYICILAFFSVLYSLLMIYASIAIGQLFEKHKILAAVIAYIVLYMILQIITLIGFGAGSLYTVEVNSVNEFQHFMLNLIPISIIFSIVLSVIFYVTTGIIMKKRINLE